MNRRTVDVSFAGTLILVALLSGCGASSTDVPPGPAADPAATPPSANVATAPTAGRADQTTGSATAAQAKPSDEGTPMPKPVPTTLAAQPTPQSPGSADAPSRERQPTASIVGIPAAAQPAVDLARADLAQQLGVAVEMTEVVGVRQQYLSTGTSDSPGRADGWRIQLATGNTRYGYHVDAQGKLSRIAPRE